MDQVKHLVDLIRSIPGGDVMIVVSAIIAIASVAVKYTPSPKDDEFLGKVKEFISKYIAQNK